MHSRYLLALITCVSFFGIMAIAWFCIFQSTHLMIRPLRHLNERMLEILEEGNNETTIHASDSCKEIK